jgi:hypothetical protein
VRMATIFVEMPLSSPNQFLCGKRILLLIVPSNLALLLGYAILRIIHAAIMHNFACVISLITSSTVVQFSNCDLSRHLTDMHTVKGFQSVIMPVFRFGSCFRSFPSR